MGIRTLPGAHGRLAYEFEDCWRGKDDARTMQNDDGHGRCRTTMGMDDDDLIETLMNDVDLRRRN